MSTVKHINTKEVNLNYKEKNNLGKKTVLCLHALGHSLKEYN